MQTDGNFVAYDIHEPLWSSGTEGNPSAYIVVQDDSNVVVYNGRGNRSLWATNTVLPSPPHPTKPTQPTQLDRLTAGQGLIPGESITSENGKYKLILQLDANLVLYAGTTPLWASGTSGHTIYPWFVTMQGDGNLVLYDSEGQAYWASRTNGNPGSLVIAQNDGNLVIYNSDGHAIWATNTVQ